MEIYCNCMCENTASYANISIYLSDSATAFLHVHFFLSKTEIWLLDITFFSLQIPLKNNNKKNESNLILFEFQLDGILFKHNGKKLPSHMYESDIRREYGQIFNFMMFQCLVHTQYIHILLSSIFMVLFLSYEMKFTVWLQSLSFSSLKYYIHKKRHFLWDGLLLEHINPKIKIPKIAKTKPELNLKVKFRRIEICAVIRLIEFFLLLLQCMNIVTKLFNNT